MFLLGIQDRDDFGKGTGLHWGGDRTEKKYTGRGGHRIYFLDWMNDWGREGGDAAHNLLMRGTIGVGTPHNIERKSKSLN